MPKIRVSYERITEESAIDGDVEESGWWDEEGVDMTPSEYDVEDGVTCVDKAAEYLLREGATEPSSSSFHPGVWYTSYGGQDWRDGSYTNHSYHLHAFTEEEQERVYAQVEGQVQRWRGL
jgi:hypothetical protein